MRIIYDITSAARQVARKTHFIYKSNLSFNQLDLYSGMLLQNGLLGEKLDNDISRVYSVTNRVFSFLKLSEQTIVF